MKSLLLTLSTFLLFNLSTALGAFEGREISRAPDMCNVDMVDTVAWYAQESVRLEVEPWRCGKRVEIPEGATAAWVVADEGGTNWIVRYDAAPGTNRCAFALSAGEGALPSGHDYTGYVSLLRGTNILGVLDRHEVRVMGQAADGGGELSPDGGCWGSLLERMAEAERDIAGIAGDLATNAVEIAELEDATNHLAAHMLPAHDEEGPWWVDAATTWPRRMDVLDNLNIYGTLDVSEEDGHTSHWPRVEGGIATNAAAIAALEEAAAGLAGRFAEYLPLAGGTVTGALGVAAAMVQGHGNEAPGADSYAGGKDTAADGAGAHAEGVGRNQFINRSLDSIPGAATDLELRTYNLNAPHDLVRAGSVLWVNSAGMRAKVLEINGGTNIVVDRTFGPLSGNGAYVARGVAYAGRSHSEGDSTTASGYAAHAEGEMTLAAGTHSHAQGYNTVASGRESSAGGRNALATNDFSTVWNAGENAYGSHGTGSWNINPEGGLDGAWVGETNLSGHLAAAVAPVEGRADALENSVASVERRLAATIASNSPALTVLTNALGQRVSEFEVVNLGFAPAMSTTETNVLLVPTNCPTRYLNINVNASSFTSTNYPLTIRIPGGWSPRGPIRIRIMITGANSAARINCHIGTAARTSGSSPNDSPRLVQLQWLPEIGAWQWYWIAMNANNGLYDSEGATKASSTGNLPNSVEEWIAWRNQQPW